MSMVSGPKFGFRTLMPICGIAMLAILPVLLIGCSVGGGSSSSPDATPQPTVAPTPTPVAQLGSVIWTTSLAPNGEPVEDIDAFPRDAVTIHAAVSVDTVQAGETLTATWALDGVAIDAIDSTVTIDEASEMGWVSFSLAWEGETLWPVGVLEVAITAGSGATTTGEIQIEST